MWRAIEVVHHLGWWWGRWGNDVTELATLLSPTHARTPHFKRTFWDLQKTPFLALSAFAKIRKTSIKHTHNPEGVRQVRGSLPAFSLFNYSLICWANWTMASGIGGSNCGATCQVRVMLHWWLNSALTHIFVLKTWTCLATQNSPVSPLGWWWWRSWCLIGTWGLQLRIWYQRLILGLGNQTQRLANIPSLQTSIHTKRIRLLPWPSKTRNPISKLLSPSKPT